MIGVALAALVIPAAIAAFIVLPTFWIRRYFLVQKYGIGPRLDASYRRFKLAGLSL